MTPTRVPTAAILALYAHDGMYLNKYSHVQFMARPNEVGVYALLRGRRSERSGDVDLNRILLLYWGDQDPETGEVAWRPYHGPWLEWLKVIARGE